MKVHKIFSLKESTAVIMSIERLIGREEGANDARTGISVYYTAKLARGCTSIAPLCAVFRTVFFFFSCLVCGSLEKNREARTNS